MCWISSKLLISGQRFLLKHKAFCALMFTGVLCKRTGTGLKWLAVNIPKPCQWHETIIMIFKYFSASVNHFKFWASQLTANFCSLFRSYKRTDMACSIVDSPQRNPETLCNKSHQNHYRIYNWSLYYHTFHYLPVIVTVGSRKPFLNSPHSTNTLLKGYGIIYLVHTQNFPKS